MSGLTVVIFIASLVTVSSWGTMTMSTPSFKHANPLNKMMKGAANVGFATSIAAAVAFGSPPDAGAINFSGSYSDPKHPGCARTISVEGKNAIVSGADGNPGCPAGEEANGKLTPWELVGRVSNDKITVDFSPKGGPKDLRGEWESGKEAGIRWPDGNKWALKGKPIDPLSVSSSG